MGVYLPPRLSVAELEERLDAMSRSIAAQGSALVLIAGDFNVHAELWGSRRTNAKDRLVQDWAAAAGLCCLNEGSESTCVKPQGESIVDLAWASPSAARKVESWRVLSNMESLRPCLYRD